MPVERQDQKPNEVENMPAAYRTLTTTELEKLKQALSEMQGWKRDVGMMKRKWFVMGALAVLIPIFLYQFYWMIRCSPHW
jgi:uncharacterized membrane protein (DUF106 family)